MMMSEEGNLPGMTNAKDQMIEDLKDAFIRKEMCDLIVKCGDKELVLQQITKPI